MGHCPECTREVDETAVDIFTSTEGGAADSTVHECPHCGVILGVSGHSTS